MKYMKSNQLIEGKSMTGNDASHLTVTYWDSGSETTLTYAISGDIARELNQHAQKPTGKDLSAWLQSKGCRLDSSDGPAWVRRWDDGVREEYYRDGRLHREGGPALITRNSKGLTTEKAYFRDGRFIKRKVPGKLATFFHLG